MKLMKLGLGSVSLLLLVLAAGSTTQVRPTKAFASELALEKAAWPQLIDYCVRTCNTYPNGTKYCGTGGTLIGCHHINFENRCIYWLCPKGPEPPVE